MNNTNNENVKLVSSSSPNRILLVIVLLCYVMNNVKNDFVRHVSTELLYFILTTEDRSSVETSKQKQVVLFLKEAHRSSFGLGCTFRNQNFLWKTSFDFLETTTFFQRMTKVYFLIGFQATVVTIVTVTKAALSVLKKHQTFTPFLLCSNNYYHDWKCFSIMTIQQSKNGVKV